MTIRVDSTVLLAESLALSQRAGDIDSLARTLPTTYDGGDAAPLIATILAACTRAGSDLAVGDAAAVDAFAQADGVLVLRKAGGGFLIGQPESALFLSQNNRHSVVNRGD